MASGLSTTLLILLFFLLGTSNTIVTKVIFTLTGTGAHGEVKPFHKPAFGNWNMFFGMALVAFPYAWHQRQMRKRAMNPDYSKKMLPSEQASLESASFSKQVHLIAWPAIFDIVGTGLSLVGIILIPASVWQMLRGAEIIFAAILTITVMGKRLYAFHWLGVFFALVGICLVSLATILGGAVDSDSGSASDGGRQTDDDAAAAQRMIMFGVAVTLLSQMVQAAQIIAEEHLLVGLDMDPLLVVTVEGFWGLGLMSLLVYPALSMIPGADNGVLEDPVDTVDMISSSKAIQFFVVMDFLSCAVYNVLGQHITKEMSGMMRVMLEATRTMCVWVFNLSWHYFVDPKSPFGEKWTSWSYLEAVGFVLLILGQMTYGEKIKWCGFDYPPPHDEVEALRASPRANFASPKASPKAAPEVELPSQQPINPKRAESQQGLAARNVKNVILTFLFFDALCIGSFSYQMSTGSAPRAQPFFDDPQLALLDRSLAFEILPSILIVSFSSDAILAMLFLWWLGDDPKWESFRGLVWCTWVSNFITLIILTTQRVAVVFSQRSLSVGVIAVINVIYMIIRFLKLLPLYRLKVSVLSIDAGEPNYEELWKYWSQEQDASSRKRLRRCIGAFAVVSFAVIILAFVQMANTVPTGVPPPSEDAMKKPSNESAQQHAPIMLSSSCDESKCWVGSYWYVCAASGTCKPGQIAVSSAFDPVTAVGVTSSAGMAFAAAGSRIGLLFGPEGAPIGAVIGGICGALCGTGAVSYKVNVAHFCKDPSDYDFPQTARDELWCAKR